MVEYVWSVARVWHATLLLQQMRCNTICFNLRKIGGNKYEIFYMTGEKAVIYRLDTVIKILILVVMQILQIKNPSCYLKVQIT